MSRREEFKTRMKALKQYRDTTGKGYWEWKVQALYEGGETQEPERVRITSDTDLTEFSKSMKDFANWWYNERNKYAKYQYQLQNIDDIRNRINNSRYLSEQDITPIILKDDQPKLYEQIQSLPEDKRNIRYNQISEQLMKGKAGFSYPSKGVYTGARNRGIMYHEGIGHIVGDTTTEILNSTPIKTLNKKVNSYFDTDQNEYNNYINQRNERHAQLWQFRGENLNVQDDKGYLIDPNRQVTPDDIKALREARKLRLPQEWINSGMTDEDIANLHNTVAQNTTTKDNEVFAGKNGGEIPSYKEGGDNEYDNLMTTIATNALRDASNRGDRALVEKILKARIGEPKEFYYPDSGAITSFLNIYDLPIIGDAFSLVDATRSLVYKDYDNASMQYLNAVLPAAILGKSKLNWKEWNLKKKYIPEYEAIEREAKKNGTWLKNEDGTDFTGDAREWVAKRSKRFKDVFGDNYKEGYTGMRNPYDPNLTTDTYLGSKDRAYTYTQNKGTVKKKGDTGIAKLVVPDTDTYTVDALGNDWLHLTDKSINPYNFTNTNQIVSKITTPTISFKNIRDDGPFGMRDIAEDQFVIKANTPKKSVLYNNGDFDLSNPDIFKTSLVPYIGYKLYNKANREDIPSYIDGGETEKTEIPDIYNTLTKEQKNRIVSAGREYTQIDPLVQLTETGVRDYSNEINTYLDKGYLEFDAGYLPEVTIGPRSRFYIPLETYYPFISDYPYTGHSEIPCFVDWGGDDLGYNLVTNNCSDKTREALEYTFNKKINPFLFTTPGDVRDFAIKQLNGIKVPTGYDYDIESDKFVKIAKPKKGMNKVLIPTSVEQYKKFKDYVLDSYQIGGETDSGNILGIEVPMWAETIASYIPVLGTAMDIKEAIQNPSLQTIGTAALSAASDLAGASIIKGLFKTTKGIDKLRKAEKALSKARKRHKLGKTQDYSEIIKASDELDAIKKQFDFKYGTDVSDEIMSGLTKYVPIGVDFFVNTGQQLQKYSNPDYVPQTKIKRTNKESTNIR